MEEFWFYQKEAMQQPAVPPQGYRDIARFTPEVLKKHTKFWTVQRADP
jgi:hypothetical protein